MVLIVVVEGTKKDEPILDVVQQLLKKLMDMLIDSLSTGLPSLQDIQHEINFILRSILPNQLTYRMQLAE